MSKTSTTSLLLLSLIAGCQCQWMSPSQDWQVNLSPDSSRFSPALLSLRSSEEQPMKSPLAGRDSFLMVSSLPEFEARPFTVSRDHRLAKKQQLSRKRSPVPSVDKWWRETMTNSNNNRNHNHNNNNGFVRITPYEYPVRVPSTIAGVEGPEFLPYPLSFQHNKVTKKQVKKNRKPVPTYSDDDSTVFSPSSSSSAGGRLELERVSANPPEFLPPTASRSSPTLEQGAVRKAESDVGRRFQSLRLGYPVRRREETAPESVPLVPDRMLGNDMMFKRNPLEADNVRSGNDVDDDPNEDFELLQ